MIIVDCEQGTEAWYAARRGVITASQLDRVIQPKKLQLSKGVEAYRNEILAEEMLGQTLDNASSVFLERGKAMESEAVDWYEMVRDVETRKVGFILTDDRRVGYSPDRLVGDDGALEIKVPSAHVHMGYLIDGFGEEYRCQCQGGLYVTGRQWVDLESYNPELPTFVQRVERDAVFQKELGRCLNQFVSYLDESRDKLIARGYLKAAIQLVAP